MLPRLISIAFLSFFMLSSACLFGVALLIWLFTSWWDRRGTLLHLFTCFWASLYIWVMPPWAVTIKGREKLKPLWKQPMIMVANHQSLLDILVCFGLFFPFKWVSKREIFSVPFIGWNMMLNRYIGINRGNKESARKMLKDCERALQKGVSVFIFPEGTRSQTGAMKAFKPGAFLLAHEQKLPIQPLVINGTKDALPKKSLGFHGHHTISLEVLDLVPYERFAQLQVEETAELIRSLILPHVKEHQQLQETVAEQASRLTEA